MVAYAPGRPSLNAADGFAGVASTKSYVDKQRTGAPQVLLQAAAASPNNLFGLGPWTVNLMPFQIPLGTAGDATRTTLVLVFLHFVSYNNFDHFRLPASYIS